MSGHCNVFDAETRAQTSSALSSRRCKSFVFQPEVRVTIAYWFRYNLLPSSDCDNLTMKLDVLANPDPAPEEVSDI